MPATAEQRSDFPATHWTLVRRAGHDATVSRRVALAELLKMYSRPMTHHVSLKLRVPLEVAEDYAQGFISAHLLDNELIAAADRNKGRFRSYLLTALDRYMLGVLRHDRAKKRRPDGTMLNVDDAYDAADQGARAPDEQFDQQWAREVIGRAIERMKADCLTSGRGDVWVVFENRLLLPMLDGVEPTPLEELAVQIKAGSVQQVSNLLVTGKRNFQRSLRSVVGEYERRADDIEAEIADLQRILSGARKGA